MVSTPIRLRAVLEWLVAAVCVAAIVATAGIVSRDGARVQPVVEVIAGEATRPVAPAAVPPGAVSVPVLILPDGKELRVGVVAAAVVDAVGRGAQVGSELIEHDDRGRRESRAFTHLGMTFVVVTSDGVVVGLYR